VSLVVTSFAPLADVRGVRTPLLDRSRDSILVLIDLAAADDLGGSALAQVYGHPGGTPADLSDPRLLPALFRALRSLRRGGLLLACHDRSDGGLLVSLCEMAFASRCGLAVEVPGSRPDALAALFGEGPGMVIQVPVEGVDEALGLLADAGLGDVSETVARPQSGRRIVVRHGGRTLIERDRVDLHRIWSETTWQMQRMRDDPGCADEEYDRLLDVDDPGLGARLTFPYPWPVVAAGVRHDRRPRVAILREQGVNGHLEMAAAFRRAGFNAVDVTMTDLMDGRADLASMNGLAACGGFSFGDVLGAGQGWAKSILFNDRLRASFSEFFGRADTFALGVCNGCQMLAAVKELIPGAEHWPSFRRNRSEQYEARLVLVEITDSRSVMLDGMVRSRIPVVVAHGEGRACFDGGATADDLARRGQVAMRFVDNRGEISDRYPYNPNGSPGGVTGLTTADGRVTILMPHPERVFRSVCLSWRLPGWEGDSPWMRLFRNARAWIDGQGS
jgi:phosphoribosylformylglycinamidine synthase